MRSTDMASIAILCLLLMERFLASDMDGITEPVLNGLRVLESRAIQYTRRFVSPDMLPSDILRSRQQHRLTRFYLFSPEFSTDGRKLDPEDPHTYRHFNPRLETKVIVHGFLDKVKIADWMHHMKDEFLLLDNFNIIIVDWSFGNFIPYSKAAANTEQVGEEISKLLLELIEKQGAKADTFHILGHSLGSHVAGYVGEKVKGLKRITGLDPATYLFSSASPRAKLDKSDAKFVDVIHTDGGGIGMVEPAGHVDFYPNGGQIQKGCTASNSLRSLLEHGVVEGVRNMICSHMRAPLLFTATINARFCHMTAYRCAHWEAFTKGECDTCGSDSDCVAMGYHMDLDRDYGRNATYYLLTSDSSPYCGYEYKITLIRAEDGSAENKNSTLKRNEWTNNDILHISVYGSNGNSEFQIEKGRRGWRDSHVVFSHTFLGDVLGAIIRWSKKPLTRMRGVMDKLSKVIHSDPGRPPLRAVHVSSLKTHQPWTIAPIVFELCVSPLLTDAKSQQGATFRSEYC